MPIKSKAQRRKFAELLVTGKITPEVYERWNRETGSAKLPERVRPKRGRKSKRVVTRTSTKKRTQARRRR
jgi:hypothetical protein